MKLNKTELSLLKKMSRINEFGSFYIGNSIWTNNNQLHVFMHMEIDDNINTEFHIINLNKFVQAYSMLDQDRAKILTNDTTEDIFITDGNNNFKIKKTRKEFTKIIEQAPDIQSPDVVFELSVDDISKIMTARSIVEADHIIFENTGITTQSTKSHIGDKFVIKRKLSDDDFRVHINSEMMSYVISDSYTVTVQKRTPTTPFVIKFKSNTMPYYYLFVETTFE